MAGLGADYDLSVGFVPVDMSAAANTSKRIDMSLVESVDVVLYKAVGTAGDDPVLTLKAHTAATGGTSANLAVITEYFVKDAVALAGTETWTKVTQAAAATITDPGGAGTSAEHQQLVAVHVRADQLPDGKPYLSLDVADVGANAQVGGVFYILHQFDKGTPDSLRAPLR